jgi:hypothetical protein
MAGPYTLTEQDKMLIDRVALAHKLHIQVLNEDDNYCDTSVDVNGSHTVELLDDGQFLVCHVTLIPGTRYHSDGSGTPDDVDVAELGTYPRFIEAFASAASLAVHQSVFQCSDSLADDLELAAQEEQIFG